MITALFDLVSTYNIIPLGPLALPLFTQHIALVDPFSQPFAAIVGAGVGEAEPFTPHVHSART